MSGATGAGPTGYYQLGAPVGNEIVNWGYQIDNNLTSFFAKSYGDTGTVQITATGPTGPFAVFDITLSGFRATGTNFSNTGGYFWLAIGT
jgi:hypothetical protein